MVDGWLGGSVRVAATMRAALVAMLTLAALPLQADAATAPYTVRFQPSPSPGVTGYLLGIQRTESGTLTYVELGNPTPAPDGTASVTIQLGTGSDHLLFMYAQTPSTTSGASNLLRVASEPVVARINAGGSDFVDSAGLFWVSDQAYAVNGVPYFDSGAIAGTSNDALYGRQRLTGAVLSYEIPLLPGNKILRLHFAETLASAPGERLMDIEAEGNTVLSGLDVFALAGSRQAVAVELPVFVGDGVLSLQLRQAAGVPGLSALEIVTEGPSLPAPTSCVVNNDCADPLQCSGTELCLDGACVAGTGATCPQGGPCQTGRCDATFGCVIENLASGTSCSDGDPNTTQDQCFAGTCYGVPAGAGCISDSQCSDGNACNGSERCLGGQCSGGTPPSCGVSSACQTGSCDALLGCVVDDVADGTSCNDGNSSTTGDQCSAGICSGTVPECIADADCANGNTCDGSERCIGESCFGGNPLDCSVTDACRVGSCDATSGCRVDDLPDGTACDDGNPATIGDACGSGVCAGTGPPLAGLALAAVAAGNTTLAVPIEDLDYVLDTTAEDPRPAWCDVDGDGDPELVIGYGTGSKGRLEVLQIDNGAVTSRSTVWALESWTSYRDLNGETRPACGDLDGDGRDEIVIGAGTWGYGYLLVLEDATQGFAPASYAHTAAGFILPPRNGRSWPAVGDFDGDGRGEIVVAYEGYRYLDFFEDATTNLARQPTRVVSLPAGPFAYIGLRVSAGDIDGDGRDELAVGVESGGHGQLGILEDAAGGYAVRDWIDAGFTAYNASDGRTVPALGDIDGDGYADLLVGLGPSGGATLRGFDDGLAPLQLGGFSNGFLSLGTAPGASPIRPALP